MPLSRTLPALGEQIGQEAFEHAQIHEEDYCLRERQRIEVANEPDTLALRVSHSARLRLTSLRSGFGMPRPKATYEPVATEHVSTWPLP